MAWPVAEGRDDHDWGGCYRADHTTRCLAGCPHGVISRNAQGEHFSSASLSDSGPSHAARNAAIASSRLSATPPLGLCVDAGTAAR